MKLLELTLPTSAENLALDEALLETAEGADRPCEILRLWEADSPSVVVGRASQVEVEVNMAACRDLNVPVFRRHSGGAAVVAGPGCLMFAVVLSYRIRPHLRMIDQAHQLVLGKLKTALQTLVPEIATAGICDLTLKGRKFSGNSLRCHRTHLLYHGTVLYDFPLELIGTCLRQPPRQPDYRNQRTHDDFVTNFPKPLAAIRQAIINAWQVDGPQADWPRKLTASLVANKYESPDWNLCR